LSAIFISLPISVPAKVIMLAAPAQIPPGTMPPAPASR